MKRMALLLLGIAAFEVLSPAQERRIEISPFAGGYFSAGFQSFTQGVLGPIGALEERPNLVPFTVGDFKPVDEPNSGIFGVRASYDLSRRFTLEGTFGFSPAGRRFTPVSVGAIVPFLSLDPVETAPPQQGQWVFTDVENFLSPRAFLQSGAFRGNDTFHYSGNVLFRWPLSGGWAPFITGGLGAVTRTAEVVFPPTAVVACLPPPDPNPALYYDPCAFTLPPFFGPVPSPIDTDFAVNFGGGAKKYFSSRYGIRFDLRDTISKVDEDTVHNLEASVGLILRF